MAGRGVVGAAAIQMTLADVRGQVYWFAGQSWLGAPVSVGTVVAFTTLQDEALVWPIRLAAERPDRRADVACALRSDLRLFDLPVDRRAERLVCWTTVSCGGVPRGCLVSLRGGSVDLEACSLTYTGHEDGDRRDGSGKTDPRLMTQLYDAEKGRVSRQHGRPRPHVRVAPPTHRICSRRRTCSMRAVQQLCTFASPRRTTVERTGGADPSRDRVASRGLDGPSGRRARSAGGERPRIAMAQTRSCATRPILVLDEATARSTPRACRRRSNASPRPDRDRDRAPPLRRPRRESDCRAGRGPRRAGEGAREELLGQGGRYAALRPPGSGARASMAVTPAATTMTSPRPQATPRTRPTGKHLGTGPRCRPWFRSAPTVVDRGCRRGQFRNIRWSLSAGACRGDRLARP